LPVLYKSFIHQTDGNTERDRQNKNNIYTQGTIKTLHKKPKILDCNILSIKSINNVSNYIVSVQFMLSSK